MNAGAVRVGRRLGWGTAALVAVLTVQLALAPQIGIPATAFALLVALVAVSALASQQLERDVVHGGLLGALLGSMGEWLLLTEPGDAARLIHGGALGMFVGALVGDEVQVSRKWMRLTRQAKTETRWWQKRSRVPRWLPQLAWGLLAAALATGAVLLLVALRGMLPRGANARLASDLFAAFHAARLESSVWQDAAAAWFALVPLAISIALGRFAARLPDEPLLIDSILRRIGVLQGAALLMLALHMIQSWVELWTSIPHEATAGNYELFLAALVRDLRLCLVPLMLLMVAQVFLGKRMLAYWIRGGWLAALGLWSLVAAIGLGFLLAYLLHVA